MTDTRIAEVAAWEALDSRGTPTVACEVRLSGGARGAATVPSGASTGRHEARELRDGGERYAGLGVGRAVRNVVEVLGPAVAGLDACDQRAVDARLRELDDSEGLARLGANAVLSVSVATALAAADGNDVPLWRHLAADGGPVLPLPMVNIVSGGAHADGAIDIQDVLVVPVGAGCVAEAIEWAWRVRRATGDEAAARGLNAALVADEGGLGPRLTSNVAALELVMAGIEGAGLEPGAQVALALDVAASQFHAEGEYSFAAEGRSLGAVDLIDELVAWCDAYPVVSIEDALAEDDWDGWVEASVRLRSRVQLIGDDLFVTDVTRLERGVAEEIANAILVKPNQTGTLTAAGDVVRVAREAGYAPVISCRSGDTEDTWLADLAVGWGPAQIKVGSTTRSERNAKWNRLLRIEAEAGARVAFAGRDVLAPLDDRAPMVGG
ncbi:MAG: phosphopyruvate hydratase [Actinobacteria bacterium]|nr:phosphopyruvate hydratase [Actinomycetota bacterium]